MKTLTISALLALALLTFRAEAQVSANPIVLTYTSSTNQVTPDQGPDLKKGSYNFKINGVNDAYHVVKFNPEYLDRVGTMPAGLPTLILNTTPTPAINHFALAGTLKKAPATVRAAVDIPPLVEEIEKHYDYIQTVVNQTKTVYKDLKTNWPTQAATVQLGTDAMTAINAAAVTDNIHNAATPDALADVLDGAIAELLGDIKTLHDNPDWSSQVLPAADLGTIYARELLINEKLADIKNCPQILKAVIGCNIFIQTAKPFTLESDFFRLNVVILQNRFDPKPDTLLQQKLVFYRTGYLKFLDISTGFFYNNLFGRSYYYKDTLGHTAAETKSRSDISIGALIHGYYVASSAVKIGIGLGASVSVLDGKTKYLMGPSLVIGRKQEFVISGGAAVASLAVPSNVVNNGQKFTSANTGAPVTTYNAVTWGYFIGLSYSLVKL